MKNFSLKLVLTLALGLGFAATASAQNLRGGVKGTDGQPVIGASVIIEGTNLGTSTDVNGQFALNVPDPAKNVLLVSFIGMKDERVNVAGRTSIDIVLHEDATQLDDVVVVGYGISKKTDLTGSVGSVAAGEIAGRGTTRLEDALQGAVPGVSVTQTNSRANGGFDIQIRGQASINNASAPLYVIDGIVCSSMDFLNP